MKFIFLKEFGFITKNATPGPAPREGFPGLCPPQVTACAPQTKVVPQPKRGLCPEETNRLGVTGVQIEA